MNVIAIANPKGGVGKTTTALALAEGLAEAYRVLLVDLDPQATLTEVCGIYEYKTPSIARVLDIDGAGAAPIKEAALPYAPNIHLVPADLTLLNTMMDLLAKEEKETVLKKRLSPVASDYDLCLVDCPPSLGLLTASALVAADVVLIPAKPEKVDVRGLVQFMDSIERIRQLFNEELQILGLVMTFFNSRLSHHKDSLSHFQAIHLPLLPVRIGRSVRIPEAMALGHSILTYDPTHKESKNYRELVKIVGHWITSHPRT